MNKLIAIILCALFISGCSSNKEYVLLSDPPGSDSNDDSFWSTIPVESTPLSRNAIIEHLELCKKTGADSQLIIYKNQIVSEWYSDRYKEPVGAMSSTKVVASLLIGSLVDAGKISYQTKVHEILPDWRGSYRDEVSIKNLLTHTAGFNRRVLKDESIGYAEKKTEFVINITPDYQPDTKFEYSNEGVQLLEPIISGVSGLPTEQYAQEILFSKIGMNETKLYNYGGSPWLYAEMQTTARDLARLGVLMNNKGKWGNQKIVSEEYVEQATKPISQNKEMGFLWWILDDSKTVKGYYASGYLNTDIYVFNEYDVVIVRTQAPKNGFTGKNESGNYFKQAMPLFMKIVKEK